MSNFKFLLFLSFLLTQPVFAKLLDKIVAVSGNEIITFSEIKRIQSNLAARRQISPFIYTQNIKTFEDLVKIQVESNLIKQTLSEKGIIVNDDQVESQIRSTEQRLGLGRQELLNFLSSNNLSFEEYFELIRQTIEFNVFNQRVILPLVSVTEQEIKNTFYKQNSKNKTLSFRYTLVDFTISENDLPPTNFKDFKETLKQFQITGNIPERYSSMATNVLGDISEDGLNENLKKILNETSEGEFSDPVKLGSDYHVFYVKKKDLVESEIYLENKDRVKSQIIQKRAEEVRNSWFKRESDDQYVRYFYDSSL